jgi:hypothetical protein
VAFSCGVESRGINLVVQAGSTLKGRNLKRDWKKGTNCCSYELSGSKLKASWKYSGSREELQLCLFLSYKQSAALG